MLASFALRALVASAALALCTTASLGAAGGAINDPRETYANNQPPGPPADDVTASVALQFVSYELNAVAGKFKLIPVLLRVSGTRTGPVALSVARDTLVVQAGGKRVGGSFQLSALDRPLWDSLSPEARAWLTYPEQLEPNGTAMVYAFVPSADLKGRVERFEYTIRSLPAPLVLEPEAKKAAR